MSFWKSLQKLSLKGSWELRVQGDPKGRHWEASSPTCNITAGFQSFHTAICQHRKLETPSVSKDVDLWYPLHVAVECKLGQPLCKTLTFISQSWTLTCLTLDRERMFVGRHYDSDHSSTMYSSRTPERPLFINTRMSNLRCVPTMCSGVKSR